MLVETLDRLVERSRRPGPTGGDRLGPRAPPGRQAGGRSAGAGEGGRPGEGRPFLEKGLRAARRWEIAGDDWERTRTGAGAHLQAGPSGLPRGLRRPRPMRACTSGGSGSRISVRAGHARARPPRIHRGPRGGGAQAGGRPRRRSRPGRPPRGPLGLGEGCPRSTAFEMLLPLIDGRRAEFRQDAFALGRGLYGERPRDSSSPGSGPIGGHGGRSGRRDDSIRRNDPHRPRHPVPRAPSGIPRWKRRAAHEMALAIPKAAAAARPPMKAVWRALRNGRAPVKRPLM